MKKKQMLATLVMLSLLQGSVYAAEPGEVDGAWSFNGAEEVTDGYVNKVDETYNVYEGVYGNGSQSATNDITGGKLTIVDGADISSVIGVASKGKVSTGIVNMTGGTVTEVTGGLSWDVDMTDMSDVIVTENGAFNNTVNFSGGKTIRIEGGMVQFGVAQKNIVNLTGGILYFEDAEGARVYGGFSTYGYALENEIIVENVRLETSRTSGRIHFYGGNVTYGNAKGNIITIKNIEKDNDNISIDVYGAEIDGFYYGDNIDINNPKQTYANENKVEIYGTTINNVVGAFNNYGFAEENKVTINGATVLEEIYGAAGNTVIGNEVNIIGNSIIGKEGESGKIVGGLSGNGNVIGNSITLSDSSTVYGDVIAGSAGDDTVKVSGNSITLQDQTNVEKADLYGYKPATTTFSNNVKSSAGDRLSNNNLIIDGWTGTANSVQNFNNIKFNNLVWNTNPDEAVLTTNRGSLAGTNVSFTLQSGQKVNVGESMTLISSSADLGTIANAGESLNTTMGVAADVSATLEQTGNKVMATVDNIELNDQTMLVAENRAVAAAFVNQGTDLIADSLDTLSRDGKYGVKTFAAVQGNRSKYDVNSDIKINGWSTIVGVGSETEHNGGDFSWGVFYENGSGNYRTFNSFNNEYFRGDGSLVYNGGGIAARYENAHGVYTEGSLRAGMLKSDMDNALSDGENKYGYSSESEYYGAHIGIGQIIPLTESSDLDVYGKFFHTYTEGDSFNVAGDEFEFDGINSDRLRVGARLTTNKENKFSTYYGLAYEYEFNGDAEMRAAGMSAPTQSLQGSSYMAEVGFNYQPTPESPWSFDLNMRGYAGEREGATFNVQATYTF